jgi:hypothetical protein
MSCPAGCPQSSSSPGSSSRSSAIICPSIARPGSSGGRGSRSTAARSATGSAAPKPWLEAQLSRIPQKPQLADDIRYTLAHWSGLIRFLDDGTLELDTNPVENQIRPIALTRKKGLFAGNAVGAENWAMLASLVAICKMSDVNPVDYIAATPSAILEGHPSAIREAASRSSCPGASCRRQASPHRAAPSRLLRIPNLVTLETL